MLDELLKKLKSQIEQLRSQLPAKLGGTKDVEEDDDEYEDEYEEGEEEEKTEVSEAGQMPEDDEQEAEEEDLELNESSDVEEDDDEYEDEQEEEEDDEQNAKAEKRSKLIKMGAVFIIIYFALDMIFEDSQEDVPVPEQVTRQRELPERVEEAPPIPDPPVAEVTSPAVSEPVVVDRPDPVREDPEPIRDEEQDDFSFDLSSFDEPSETVLEQEEVVQEQVEKVEQEQEQEQATPSVSDIALGQEQEREEVSTVDSLLKAIEQSQRAQFVAPPDYERVGRGLVYNCEGRHWACVDRESYFDCQDNLKWNQQEEVALQCYPVAVYASDEDCRIVQLYNINTSESTDFCQQE